VSTRVTLLYFAGLRDASRVAAEPWETGAATLKDLYAEVQAHHGLPFPARQLRVAVDGEFAQWDDTVRNDTEIAFIPPVSGG
jgi:molybdopterin synthase sulfur carrier subunit